MRAILWGLAGALIFAAPAPAQLRAGVGRPQEPPPYVSLEEILASFDLYRDRVVRTSGRLDIGPRGRFRMRDDDGNPLDIVALDPVRAKFDVQARTSLGRQVEVTGVLREVSAVWGAAAHTGTLLTLYFDSYTIASRTASPDGPEPRPTARPSPKAADPPGAGSPAPPPPAVAPPTVIFAVPAPGDVAVPSDSRFTVQFSADMDESSFAGRVLLRYLQTRPGDPPFDGVRLAYDTGRRALSVDPGRPLLPGRAIELRLRPGITDMQGRPLVPRGGAAGGEGDVLRYGIAP